MLDWLSVFVKVCLVTLIQRVLSFGSVLKELNYLLGRKVLGDIADLPLDDVAFGSLAACQLVLGIMVLAAFHLLLLRHFVDGLAFGVLIKLVFLLLLSHLLHLKLLLHQKSLLHLLLCK